MHHVHNWFLSPKMYCLTQMPPYSLASSVASEEGTDITYNVLIG